MLNLYWKITPLWRLQKKKSYRKCDLPFLGRPRTEECDCLSCASGLAFPVFPCIFGDLGEFGDFDDLGDFGDLGDLGPMCSGETDNGSALSAAEWWSSRCSVETKPSLNSIPLILWVRVTHSVDSRGNIKYLQFVLASCEWITQAVHFYSSWTCHRFKKSVSSVLNLVLLKCYFLRKSFQIWDPISTCFIKTIARFGCQYYDKCITNSYSKIQMTKTLVSGKNNLLHQNFNY